MNAFKIDDQNLSMKIMQRQFFVCVCVPKVVPMENGSQAVNNLFHVVKELEINYMLPKKYCVEPRKKEMLSLKALQKNHLNKLFCCGKIENEGHR